jgi:hypothetical protein
MQPTIPPPTFELLEKRSRFAFLFAIFEQYVWVDSEWSRMVFVSLVPTLATILARVVGYKACNLEIMFLTPAWARWGQTLTLVSLTWLVSSSLGTAANPKSRNNWIFSLISWWGMTLTMTSLIEAQLAVQVLPSDSFTFWLVLALTGVNLLLTFGICVAMKISIRTEVVRPDDPRTSPS